MSKKKHNGKINGESAEKTRVQEEKPELEKTPEEKSEANPKNASADEEKTEQSAEEKPLSDAEKIEALEKEKESLNDQLLRRAADFDNYRKRMIKEKQDALEYGTANLLKDLLDSLDNFDRTLDAAANATDIRSIVDGIKMVSGNLVSMLENKYGLTGYGKPGDIFNPDEHEAIGSVQGDVKEPVLKDVYLKGYKLKDRVIRHAKVMVTIPSE